MPPMIDEPPGRFLMTPAQHRQWAGILRRQRKHEEVAREGDGREEPAGRMPERNQPAARARVGVSPASTNSKPPPRDDCGGALVLGTRRSLSLPPSEPRRSAE